MSRKKTVLGGLSLGLLLAGQVLGQQARYEARLSSRRVDCAARTLEVALEIRASDAASSFRMGNGNFRFTYDPGVLKSPVIARQHNFSAAAETPDANYAPQSLNGSAERPGAGIVSVNVIYAGGDKSAALVGPEWMPVATLAFELVDPQAATETTLRLHDDKTFPVSGLDEVVIASTQPFDYDSREVAGVFQSLTLPAPRSICSNGAEASGELQLPEGFSPNGDGQNDRFVIKNLGALKAAVQVFDRLGTVVYDSKDYQNEWDGSTDRGRIAPGTYFYTVRLSDGRRFSKPLTVIW